MRTVVVLGGTGKFGRVIVDALLDADFRVSIVSRNATAAKAPSKARLITSNYTYDSLVSIFTGQDVVVSAVAVGPAIVAQKTMIDAAVAAGVKRFIPSEYGSSSLDIPLDEFKKLMRPKTQIIEYLRKVASENPAFTWSCISAGASFDIGIKSGTWGFSLSDRTATIYDTGKARFDSTTLPVTALSVVSTLRNPAQTANEYLLIKSFVLTQNDILAALEKATGTKWTVVHRDSVETRQQGWKLIESGNPQEGIPKVIQGSLFNDKTDVVVAEKRLVNGLLNLPDIDLGEYVKALVGTQ